MPPRVLIVSHDAGGAEVLSAWCGQHAAAHRIDYWLDGPARRIFERDFGHVPLSGLDCLNEYTPDDFVLTGSSLDADLERRAIAHCRRLGIRSITFLEHWDLYRERFDCRSGLQRGLPDEIWVGDSYALAFARAQGFPQDRLRLVPNPYFEKVRQAAGRNVSSSPAGKSRILYVCEPISRKLAATYGDKAAAFDDEILLVRHFLESAARFRDRVGRITLRLHPSETPAKYEQTVATFRQSVPLACSQLPDLVNDLASHEVVVGVESMALVMALVMGRPRVYSVITGKQWPISLPHREIRRLAGFDEVFESLPISEQAA